MSLKKVANGEEPSFVKTSVRWFVYFISIERKGISPRQLCVFLPAVSAVQLRTRMKMLLKIPTLFVSHFIPASSCVFSETFCWQCNERSSLTGLLASLTTCSLDESILENRWRLQSAVSGQLLLKGPFSFMYVLSS